MVRLVLRYRDYQRTTKRLAGIPRLLERLRQVSPRCILITLNLLMTKQQATSLTNSILSTTCCLHTWALHSSRFMHTDTQTNHWVYVVVCCARPLFPVFLNPGHPVALFLSFMMNVWALWFSPFLISQGVLLFMCFAVERSVSRFHTSTACSQPSPFLLSFRHRTFTWKWNGSLQVGVGATS